jgi:hypothetical protein
MPNKYSRPIQDTPIDTYVGQPLEAMERALTVRQGYYDQIEGLGISAKTALGGIEGYGTYAQTKLQEKQKDLDEFTKQYANQDLTSPDIATAFKQKVSDLSSDPEIQNIQQVSSMVKQFKSNLQEARKDKDFAPENIYKHQKALQKYSETGEIDPTFDATIDKGVDVFDEASKYFKILHESGGDAVASIAAGDGTSVYYTNGSVGISSGKINEHAKNTFNEFLSSAAGRQLQRRYEMQAEQNGQKPTPQGAVQYVAQTFQGIGQGFAWNKSSSTLAGAMNKKADLGRKAKEDKEKKKQAMLSVPFAEFNSSLEQPEFDDKGKIKGEGGIWEKFNQTLESTGSWKKAASSAIDYLTSDEQGVTTAAQAAKYAPMLDAMGEVNSKRVKAGQRPYTDKEWFTSAQKKRMVSVDVNLDKKVQDSYENILVNNGAINNLRMIDPKDPSNKNLTGDGIIRKYLDLDEDEPITPDHVKTLNIKVISVPTATSFSPSAIGLSINGKPYLGDLSDAMGNPDQLIPKDAAEATAINQWNYGQAALKGGTHTFIGYEQTPNGMQPVKWKAVHNPIDGTTSLKELKDKKK